MALENRQGSFIFKAITIVVAVWALSLLAVFAQYKQISKMSENIVDLSNSIMSFHNSLHFRPPYRVTNTNDMSLNIQLIYSQRVQLEKDYKASWLQPDVTHLIYVIDRFIDKSQLFLAKDLDVLNMVEQLKLYRNKYADQPELRQYYVELGSYMFEALFTEGEQSPEIYRSLDRIMQESLSLPETDRQHLQVTLAKVSTLLSQYAESNSVVDRLLKNEIYKETYSLEHQYHHLLSLLNISVVVMSILLLISLVVIVVIRERQIASVIQSLSEPQPTPQRNAEPKNSNGIDVKSHTRSASLKGDKLPVESRAAVESRTAVESKIDIQQMLTSLNGDKESVKMLLKVFIEDHQNDGKNFKQLLNTDLSAAMRTAHSLKGVAATIGAVELRAIAVEIEAKLKQGELPDDQEIQRLVNRLEAAVKSAKYWLDKDWF